MSFKHIVCNILPDSVANYLRQVKSLFTLRKEYGLQAERFNKTFSREWSTGLMQVQTRVIFLTHQIEKGLGHREFRYGFGVRVFKALGPELAKLETADSGYLNNPAYRECMSAVHEYIVRHEAAGKDVSEQRRYFGIEHWERAKQSNDEYGGSIVVTAAEKRIMHKNRLLNWRRTDIPCVNILRSLSLKRKSSKLWNLPLGRRPPATASLLAFC